MRNHTYTTALIACLFGAALLVLAAGAAQAAEPNPIKVFLLAGQSNMDGRAATSGLPAALQSPQADVLLYEGTTLGALAPSGSDFGPEITFGRTIADEFPAESFALIKYAVGGTDLHTNWAPGGSNYNTWISKVAAGLNALIGQGYEPEIVGMLWTQGERDAKDNRTTAQYQADLNTFVADMRTRYGSDMPFFLSRLSINQTNISDTQLATIRAAQANFADGDPLSYMIDTDSFGLNGDNLHFSTAGQMALGEAFANSYIATTPEPASLAMLAIGGMAVLRRRRGK